MVGCEVSLLQNDHPKACCSQLSSTGPRPPPRPHHHRVTLHYQPSTRLFFQLLPLRLKGQGQMSQNITIADRHAISNAGNEQSQCIHCMNQCFVSAYWMITTWQQ